MIALSATLDEQKDGASGESVSIEVNEWATRATLDIIGQGGFGQSFNAIQDPENELSRTYRSIFKQGRTGQILGLLGFLLPQWLLRRLPYVSQHLLFLVPINIKETADAVVNAVYCVTIG